MKYRNRKNTIQQRLVRLLNNKMTIGVWYPYSDIIGWCTGYKEGTLSSVLSKCKSIGSLEHNTDNGDRRRQRDIEYLDMLSFSKTNKTVSNNLGVTQAICDKVKALRQVDFTNTQITTVLSLNESIVTDITNCEFNIHKYNDYWRESTAPKEANVLTLTNQDGLESMASKIKDDVDNLVNTVWHLASRT